MITKITSKIRYALRIFVLILIFISCIIVYALTNGIKFDNLKLLDTNINSLYIKLDKKLTVKVDSIEIYKKKQSTNAISDITTILDNFFAVINYFEEIEIKKLIIDKENIYIKYNKELFNIKSNEFTLETTLAFNNPTILMNIKSATYKKLGISIDGKVEINAKEETAKLNINIKKDKAILYTSINIEKDKIDISANSNTVKSISFIKSLLSDEVYSKTAKEWTFDRVIAKNYTIKHFSLSMDRNFNVDFKSLKAVLIANDCKITFQDDKESIKVDTIYGVLNNDNLSFKLQNPKHKDRDLKGTTVSIRDMYNHSFLNINIKAKATLDKEILDIVSFYGVKIPVLQKDGVSEAIVDIDVDLHDESTKVNVIANTKNSTISLYGLDLYVKDLSLEVLNNDILINNADLLFKDILDGNFKATIDLKEERIVGDLFINKLFVKDIIDIKDITTPLDISYKQDVVVDIIALNTTVINKNKYTQIKINSIKDILNNLVVLKNTGVSSGNADIITKDFEEYFIKANIDNFDSMLYKNGKKVTDLNLTIKYNNDKTEIFTQNRDINIIYKDKIPDVKIENYDVNIDLNNTNEKSDTKKINLMMNDGNIFIKNHKILFGLLKAQINDNNTKVIIQHKDTTLKALIDKNNIKITGKKIDDEYINTLLGTKKFKGGEFNLNAQGTKEYISGTLNVKNTKIEDFLLLNNLISFINSLPLLTANPLFIIPSVVSNGFSTSGYDIKWGELFFGISDKKFIINHLSMFSDTSDIKGSGIIDFDTKQIDIKLSVSILKNFTSIIEYIPLVNYILLGKDGTINISINVKGTIDNPTFDTTETFTDAIKTPLNIIERTIKLPFESF